MNIRLVNGSNRDKGLTHGLRELYLVLLWTTAVVEEQYVAIVHVTYARQCR